MGAAFALNWPQPQACNEFEEVFGVVWLQSEQNSMPLRNCGLKMDVPQQSEDQIAFGTVGLAGWIVAEEGESETDNQQIHESVFLEATLYNTCQ